MREKESYFHKFSSFMDQNIRMVQYGVYGIAGLGLLVALRSVKPFAKFTLPSDIPSHFVDKRMPFSAKVKLVEPSRNYGMNPLLLVDHHPVISLPIKKKSEGLPLEISSVNITNNGFIWLQSILTGHDITFVPLRTTKDRVYCILFSKEHNVGLQLVKIGFATVSPIDVPLEHDEYYLKYYKKLLAVEKKAERKGAGLWAGTKISFPKLLLEKFKNLLSFSQ